MKNKLNTYSIECVKNLARFGGDGREIMGHVGVEEDKALFLRAAGVIQ